MNRIEERMMEISRVNNERIKAVVGLTIAAVIMMELISNEGDIVHG